MFIKAVIVTVPFVLYIIWRLVLWFGYQQLDISGSVLADTNLTIYGFGERKQLIILDITDIGSVQNIDASDKKYARMSWSDINNPIEWKDIGLELKGGGLSERDKLNYDIELWEDKDENTTCISPETCDDRKEKIFGFSEKYEDFILRGSMTEPTFVREMFPFKAKGGILETTLVEVLIKNGDKYYYEGVYVLITKIGRRVLEKQLKWEDDLGFEGKAEDCDDDDYDISHTSLIAEFTNNIGVRESKWPCPLFEDFSVKMRYPKCDDYDDPDWATCREDYINRTNHFVSVLEDKNSSEVRLDLDSFVDKYYFEKLWNKHDWASEYAYVSPDSVLHVGPRWDYDDILYWNTLPSNSFNLFYNFARPYNLWLRLGKHPGFIAKIKAASATIQENNRTFNDLISLRRSQREYFERNDERWNVYNKRYKKMDPHFVYYGASIKRDFIKQLDDIENKVHHRTEWLSDNIEHLESFTYESCGWNFFVMGFVLDLSPIGLYIGLIIWITRTPDQSSKKDQSANPPTKRIQTNGKYKYKYNIKY